MNRLVIDCYVLLFVKEPFASNRKIAHLSYIYFSHKLRMSTLKNQLTINQIINLNLKLKITNYLVVFDNNFSNFC